MQKRKFDELVSYFNKKVSEMEIETKYKMELLGMVTALGCAHEKEMSDLSETKRDSSDLISRQEAIDALHMHLMYRMGTDSNKKRLDDWINNLPSAQPEQRWIPCSERLPEESGYYIITAHDGVGHRTTFIKFQKKAKSWDLTGARSHWRVIAWIPLPEPYRGE